MTYWVVICIGIAAAATIQTALLLIQTWEHRRFARSRLRKAPISTAWGRAMVFAPCKGPEPQLLENLRPLLEQDRGMYEVVFIVESNSDPACHVVRRLLAEYPRRAQLLIAGPAIGRGQKVHNLFTATANIPADVTALAFVDADARPSRRWLRCLTGRLERGGDAVTGYRWFVPQRETFANWLLAGVNATIASLLGPGQHHLAWGGSWAVRREVFDAAGVRDSWRSALSDDLSASAALRRGGFGIEYEPACLVSSPLDVGFREAWQFLRRQFVIGRIYATKWWTLALFGHVLAVFGYWGGWIACICVASTNPLLSLIIAVLTVATGVMTSVRNGVRQDIAARTLPNEARQFSRAALFDRYAGGLISLVGLVAIIASAVGRTIVWRDVRYHLGRDGRVLAIQRRGEVLPSLSGTTSAPHSLRPRRRRELITPRRRSATETTGSLRSSR